MKKTVQTSVIFCSLEVKQENNCFKVKKSTAPNSHPPVSDMVKAAVKTSNEQSSWYTKSFFLKTLFVTLSHIQNMQREKQSQLWMLCMH
jgi:hypothetical protein